MEVWSLQCFHHTRIRVPAGLRYFWSLSGRMRSLSFSSDRLPFLACGSTLLHHQSEKYSIFKSLSDYDCFFDSFFHLQGPL